MPQHGFEEGPGDGVLAFLKGLIGGGGEAEAPPIAPEPGTELGGPKPWEVGLGDPAGEPVSGPVGGVDTGSAAPPVGLQPEEAPQTDAPSLIEALINRNKEFAPYRDTGLGIE